MRIHVSKLMFPLLINIPIPRKVVIATIVGAVSLMLTGVFVYEVYAQPIITAHNSAPLAASRGGTVYLAPSSQAAAAAPSQSAPIIEVHIANDGLTYLRGAHVISVSGSTIRTEITLGAGAFVWNIETGYNTQFYNQNGAKVGLSDIQPGDYLSVTGKLSSAGIAPGVTADVIRN